MQFLHGYSDSVYVGDTSLGTYPFPYRTDLSLSAVQTGEEFAKNFKEAPDAVYAQEAFSSNIIGNSGIKLISKKLNNLTVGQAQILLGPLEEWPEDLKYPNPYPDPSSEKNIIFFFQALETAAKLVPALSSVISAKITEFRNKPLQDLSQALSVAIGQVKKEEKERSLRMRRKILLGGGLVVASGWVYFVYSRSKSEKR